jgi:hypothetical protein
MVFFCRLFLCCFVAYWFAYNHSLKHNWIERYAIVLPYENIVRLYKSKKSLKQIDLNEFQDWYNSKNGSCEYCDLTEDQSSILFDKYPESTRGG